MSLTRFLQVESCCFCASLRTGAKLFGFISLIGCLLMFLVSITNLCIGIYHHELTTGEEIIVGVNFLLQILQAGTSILLLMGIYQGKASLLPWWLISTPPVAVLETVMRIAKIHFVLLLHSFDWNWVLFIAFLLVDDIYGWLVVFSYYRSIRRQSPDNGGARL